VLLAGKNLGDARSQRPIFRERLRATVRAARPCAFDRRFHKARVSRTWRRRDVSRSRALHRTLAEGRRRSLRQPEAPPTLPSAGRARRVTRALARQPQPPRHYAPNDRWQPLARGGLSTLTTSGFAIELRCRLRVNAVSLPPPARTAVPRLAQRITSATFRDAPGKLLGLILGRSGHARGR